MSVNQKSDRKTFRRRFVSGKYIRHGFRFALLAGMLFQSETKIEPDLRLSCIMGNQGKMTGNSKICIRIQSQLIISEFIYQEP